MSRKLSDSEKGLSAPTTSIFLRIGKPLAGALFLVGLVKGLIYLVGPPNHLEPYEKFKESAKLKKVVSDPLSGTLRGDQKKAAAQKRREFKQLAQSLEKKPTGKTIALPRQTFVHIGNGIKFAEDGKADAANEEFAKAAEISPDTAEVYSLWGVALRLAERYSEAEKKFQRAYSLSPNDEEITFNYAMSQLQADKTSSAIKLFKKTIELNPKNHMAYNLLGKALGREKQYVQESLLYRKAVEIKPDFALGYFNLGVVLGLRKQYIESVPYFKKAIELDKQYAKPFVTKFLKEYGPIWDSIDAERKKAAQAKDPEQTKLAKLDSNSIVGAEKSNPGEDFGHNMEGSSADIEKETTNLRGKILVNGEAISPQAVVFLETKDKLPVKDQGKPTKVTISQKGLQFLPKHAVVMVGSEIEFFNHDMEPHNIYSKSLNNQFNLGAMGPGSTRTIKITEAGPITLRCNLHKEMVGTVFAVPNGYYTQPNGVGEYFFKDVKSKEYFLYVWHPRLHPREVEKYFRSIGLTGKDTTIDFKIQSTSTAGEIHDLVDEKDYDAIVNDIETLIYRGIDAWKQGKKYLPRKRLLLAITKHFEGEGLKGAIAKSFSVKRSTKLENKLDAIRKKVSGLKVDDEPVTENSLKSDAQLVISQLRENARELKLRLNPLQE
ncbi:MAG: tetratricopeptide repeat protein [Nitrospinota bacterium]|nr:tetratricopeptide repeat protein [Nitrospinota bacterium]